MLIPFFGLYHFLEKSVDPVFRRFFRAFRAVHGPGLKPKEKFDVGEASPTLMEVLELKLLGK